MRCDAMRCDAMQCDALRCDAMRCDAMRCDAMRGDVMRCDAMRCAAMRCDAMQCDATWLHSISGMQACSNEAMLHSILREASNQKLQNGLGSPLGIHTLFCTTPDSWNAHKRGDEPSPTHQLLCPNPWLRNYVL